MLLVTAKCVCYVLQRHRQHEDGGWGWRPDGRQQKENCKHDGKNMIEAIRLITARVGSLCSFDTF